MKAIILAGGKGTRLTPYTRILPKPLIPIGDLPILEILLRQMKKAGIEEVILTTGHLAGLLHAFFQDGRRLGLDIRYSYEEDPLGTAGPLSLIEGLDETFIVSNGDILTTLDLKLLAETHSSSDALVTIATHKRKVQIDLGVIQFDTMDYQINDYVEKPAYNFQVSMGIYVFEPRVLDYIEHKQYLDFPDLILRLINAGELVRGYPYEGYWQDLGNMDDYEQAVQDFEEMKSQLIPDDGNQN